MARQCGLLAMLLLSLVGCVSTASKDIFVTEKIDSPREIAISGTRAPWVFEIEKRLRAKGFSVKRWSSQNRSIEQVTPDKVEVYNEASTRLILRIDGYAPNTSMTRCFGGGYDFEFITAEIIDAENNETLAAYSNSGYSEGCQPLSGTIFGDVVSMVEAVFR
jgi:hypothetical protein